MSGRGFPLTLKEHIQCALIFLCVLAVPALTPNALAQDGLMQPQEEARKIAMRYQKALKDELQNALQTGGLKSAVEICHSRAPKIAQELGQQTGWSIHRTSLKTRNSQNKPTDKELSILEDFEKRKNKGEEIANLEWIAQENSTIHYMKAIPMKAMCANCHGESVSPALKKQIAHYYPDDIAINFKTGDIRGAFTLKKYLQ